VTTLKNAHPPRQAATPSTGRHRLALLPTLLLVAFVTGCAVQPRALTPQDRQDAVTSTLQRLYTPQEPVQAAITLDEAMARALKYNLDHRVKQMEDALAQRQFDLANLDLLPRLAATAGYTSRDSELASSSKDIVTGAQSLVPSTSTDRQRGSADLTLTWNVLDFGVSYYGAHQQADRWLAAQERRRKVVQLLMQQTRQAWWQAAGAQQLEGRITPMLEQARAALADARKVESERLRSPLEALAYQRQLLDVVRQLESVRAELAQAKPRLASLMNLAPGQAFTVDVPATLEVPTVGLPTAKMEETAMLRRPELAEAQYQERIGLLETRRAMARLFPGLELSLGGHHDSNSYLVNNTWSDVGVRVSWNLLNVLQADRLRGAAQAQYDLARQQHLALNMAVLTQVHLSHLEYQSRVRQFDLAQQSDTIEQRILQQTSNAASAQTQSKLEEIRAATLATMSALRLHQSYAALQGAYGQLVATLGLDPLPATVASHELPALRQAVRDAEQAWRLAVDPK
jgi:outer membrane protein TolC